MLISAVYQVRVGHDKLVGEIIKLEGTNASIQVYEDTCTYRGQPLCTIRCLGTDAAR